MTQPMTAFPRISRLLLSILALTLLCACGSDDGRGGAGSISFSVKMPPQDDGEVLYRDAAFPCATYGIETVLAQVSSGELTVATGGPWPCVAGEGTITGVEEGRNYTVTISMRDAGNRVLFRGSKGGINVAAGQITDAGEIVVTALNSAPVFTPVADQQVNEGQVLSFTVVATDPDGDDLTYSAVSLPDGAEFDPDTRQFHWVPGEAQAGTHTATFQATDSGLPPLSASLTVTITVGGVNRPPVLTVPASPVRFTPGVPSSFSVSATDPDGDTLTYDAAYMPRDWWDAYINGPSFNPVSRIFTWPYPDDGDVGEYKVLFRVTDDGTPRMSDHAWVTLHVYSDPSQLVNSRYPVLGPIGSRQVEVDELVSFMVTASDPDENPLSYAVSAIPGKQPPEGYSFGVTAARLFSWSPKSTGNFWLRFTVTDPADHTGYGLSDHEDVVFTVGAVNRPPVMDPIGRRYVERGSTISFVVTATDPDNDSLIYTTGTLPPGAAFDSLTQTFTWNVLLDIESSTYTVRFTVTDDGTPAESDYEDVPIWVD